MTAFPLNDTDYLAEDIRLFHAARTVGIMNVTGTDFQVSAAGGMNITVKNGAAFLHTKNDEIGGVVFSPRQDVSLTVDTAEYFTRYDYVAIRYTQSSNTVSVVYQKGTAEYPAPVRNQTQFELIVAVITVRSSVGEITNDIIHDTRMNEDLCGLTVDGLLRIDTDAFYNEWTTFIEKIRQEAEDFDLTNVITRLDELEYSALIEVD